MQALTNKFNRSILFFAVYLLSVGLLWLWPAIEQWHFKMAHFMLWRILYFYIAYTPGLTFLLSLWEIRERKHLVQAWIVFLSSIAVFILIQRATMD